MMNIRSNNPTHVLGGGLSGLSAATVLAKAGREVHVHEMRVDSGARFQGDFQALENFTSDQDFLDELREWGIDSSEFKVTGFREADLIHPDASRTRLSSSKIVVRIVKGELRIIRLIKA